MYMRRLCRRSYVRTIKVHNSKREFNLLKKIIVYNRILNNMCPCSRIVRPVSFLLHHIEGFLKMASKLRIEGEINLDSDYP